MSVNRATLVANLGADPELKHTPSGVAVCTFSVATTEKYKKKDGEKVEDTTWHKIVVWQQLAEICAKYLNKGSQVYLEGKINNRSYDDRDGKKCFTSEVVCDKMQMLGSKPEGQRHAKDPGASQKQHEEPPFNPEDDIPF